VVLFSLLPLPREVALFFSPLCARCCAPARLRVASRRTDSMEEKGRLGWLLLLMVAGAAIATGLDHRDDAMEGLSEEQDAVMSDAAESESAATAHLKHRIAHAHKRKISASHLSATAIRPHSLKAGAGDNGVNKPWQFFATNYTLTLSWISFSVIVVISCFLGGVGGWCTRKACGERKSHGFDVDVNAHNLYT